MRMTSFNNFSFGRLNSIKNPKKPEKPEEEGKTQGSTQENKPAAPAAPAEPVKVQRMIPLDDVLAIRASWIKPEIPKPGLPVTPLKPEDPAEPQEPKTPVAPETPKEPAEPTVPTEPENPVETTETPEVTQGNNTTQEGKHTNRILWITPVVEEFLDDFIDNASKKDRNVLFDIRKEIINVLSDNIVQLNPNGTKNILNMLRNEYGELTAEKLIESYKDSRLTDDLKKYVDIYNRHNAVGDEHNEGSLFGVNDHWGSQQAAKQKAAQSIIGYDSEIPNSNINLLMNAMSVFGNNLDPRDTKDLMAKLSESMDLKGDLSFNEVLGKIDDYVTHIDEHRANNPEYKPMGLQRTDLTANALRDVIAGYNQDLQDKLNNIGGEIDAIKSIIEDGINGDATFGG